MGIPLILSPALSLLLQDTEPTPLPPSYIFPNKRHFQQWMRQSRLQPALMQEALLCL